jgi:hypothetical protein
MKPLYHIRPYFEGISPYIGLKNRPKIYGRYLQSVPEMATDYTDFLGLWSPPERCSPNPPSHSTVFETSKVTTGDPPIKKETQMALSWVENSEPQPFSHL